MSLFSFLLGRWQTDGAFAIYPPPPISFKFLLLTSALEEACRGVKSNVDFRFELFGFVQKPAESSHQIFLQFCNLGLWLQDCLDGLG